MNEKKKTKNFVIIIVNKSWLFVIKFFVIFVYFQIWTCCIMVNMKNAL